MLRKIALKEEHNQKNKYSNPHPQIITTQANIAHVEPDLWSKLPMDIKQLILRERKKEAEAKGLESVVIVCMENTGMKRCRSNV